MSPNELAWAELWLEQCPDIDICFDYAISSFMARLQWQQTRGENRRGLPWRLDFAHPESKVGVEIHGKGHGIHQEKAQRDWDKLNLAQASGWVVFQFSPEQITVENVIKAREVIDERYEASRRSTKSDSG